MRELRRAVTRASKSLDRGQQTAQAQRTQQQNRRQPPKRVLLGTHDYGDLLWSCGRQADA